MNPTNPYSTPNNKPNLNELGQPKTKPSSSQSQNSSVNTSPSKSVEAVEEAKKFEELVRSYHELKDLIEEKNKYIEI